MSVLNLNAWSGVIPVVLPWAQPTISPIGAASLGVALPFFAYVIAMFMLVVPIWMQNFESDSKPQEQEKEQQGIGITVGMDAWGGRMFQTYD